MIPYGRQDITQADIDAVIAVLNSDYLTQGPTIEKFERSVMTHTGALHAVAVSNATAALHIACLALDLGPGDWLWTSPNTFVASANCALYCGAQVDFVDIDPQTYNLCAKNLEAKLIQAQQANRLPKVVVPVHLTGQPCDMAAIHALGQKYGFKIIEDASHAIGGQYKGEPIGNGRYSDITVFHAHLNILGYESLHVEMPLNFPESDQTNSAIETLLTAATGGHLSYEIVENPLNRQGICEGPLVGGNLTLLISLLGSPSALSTDGKILFIEEVGEKLYHIDRMMLTLKRAGKFDKLAGLIVGALNDMTESDLKFGKTAEEIVFEAVSEYNFPVCFGFPAGHVPDNRALIFGRHTRLEVGKSVKIDFI